jgi:hypothetical protein
MLEPRCSGGWRHRYTLLTVDLSLNVARTKAVDGSTTTNPLDACDAEPSALRVVTVAVVVLSEGP